MESDMTQDDCMMQYLRTNLYLGIGNPRTATPLSYEEFKNGCFILVYNTNSKNAAALLTVSASVSAFRHGT